MRARFMALALTAGQSLSGCSWLGGWFGSDAPKVKPADLVDFAPSVVVSRAWEVGVGAGKPFTFSGATLIRLRGDRIAYQGDFYDANGFLKQLGYAQ